MSGESGLYTALLAFQADPPHIPLDSQNPHFRSKFASLPKVLDLVRPKLAEVGLVWTTMPGHNESVGPVLRYRLAHAATGEFLDGEMPLMVAKADPQGLGSAITYARRYSLLAVLGLAGDEDDDGNSASGTTANRRRRATPAPESPSSDIPAQAPGPAKLDLPEPEDGGIDPGFANDIIELLKKKQLKVADIKREFAAVGLEVDNEHLSKETLPLVPAYLTVKQATAMVKRLGHIPDKKAA